MAKLCIKECNYIIFHNSTRTPNDLDLLLFRKQIPRVTTVRFLGMDFDERFTFNEYISNIRTKCANRMNIIRILANKSWKINKGTLASVYKSLILSIIDCTSITHNIISQNN